MKSRVASSLSSSIGHGPRMLRPTWTWLHCFLSAGSLIHAPLALMGTTVDCQSCRHHHFHLTGFEDRQDFEFVTGIPGTAANVPPDGGVLERTHRFTSSDRVVSVQDPRISFPRPPALLPLAPTYTRNKAQLFAIRR